MQHRILLIVAVLLAAVVLASCGTSNKSEDSGAPEISGEIQAGLRVLTLDPTALDQHFRIYRGDYVRVELPAGQPFTLEIPSLEVSHTVPVPEGDRPYFKVPNAGIFEFTLGEATGTIEAIEYQAAHYREVNARDAAGLIANLDPLILDVRTANEFAGGHLENAVLIPVQEIQRRVTELDAAKDRPLLVYCRSGNRSTVAARVLVDAGFNQVVNLRKGLNEWNREGLPTVK